MAAWKGLVPSGLTLTGGLLSVLQGAPWQVALPWTLLFFLCTVMGRIAYALWRAWETGTILHIREHQETLKSCTEKDTIIVRLREERDELYRLAARGTDMAVELAKLRQGSPP